MTAQPALFDAPPTAACPVCWHRHRLTRDGRLWTHGPRRKRCRGSQRHLEGARVAAADIRGSPGRAGVIPSL